MEAMIRKAAATVQKMQAKTKVVIWHSRILQNIHSNFAVVQVDGLPILKLKKMALSRDLTMILIWETPGMTMRMERCISAAFQENLLTWPKSMIILTRWKWRILPMMRLREKKKLQMEWSIFIQMFMVWKERTPLKCIFRGHRWEICQKMYISGYGGQMTIARKERRIRWRFQLL